MRIAVIKAAHGYDMIISLVLQLFYARLGYSE
jgi:hypothetical protein